MTDPPIEECGWTFDEACERMAVDAETMLTWLRSGMPVLKEGNWETGGGFVIYCQYLFDHLFTLHFLTAHFADREAARILRVDPTIVDRF